MVKRRGSMGGAAGSSRSMWNASQRRAEQMRKPNADAGPVLGGKHCWCGAQLGHTWPGKKRGKPHPPADSPQSAP